MKCWENLALPTKDDLLLWSHQPLNYDQNLLRMLEEAHWLRSEGTDVVVGLLETHNRAETIGKSIGLELIPR